LPISRNGENVAQRGGNEMRVFADQQFQAGGKIFVRILVSCVRHLPFSTNAGFWQQARSHQSVQSSQKARPGFLEPASTPAKILAFSG
jgi:hypothetical protein